MDRISLFLLVHVVEAVLLPFIVIAVVIDIITRVIMAAIIIISVRIE